MINPRVYFDIKIAGEKNAGRIVFELRNVSMTRYETNICHIDRRLIDHSAVTNGVPFFFS